MLESIYKVFVPSGLILLMLGMGMQLVPEDWKRVMRYPRAVLLGLLGQFVLLPAIAFGLIYSLSLPLAVSAGILILAVCPGGVVSNTVSFLARADIPLSVTLTAISSILALVTVPLILHFGLDIIQSTGEAVVAADRVVLPIGGTVKQLLVLVFLPLITGMLVRRYASNFALRSDPWMRAAGVLVLVVLLVGSVAMEFDFFMQNLSRLWFVLLVLNLATLLGGYALALVFGMDGVRRRTIAIEVGIQNVALGAMVALNILQQPEWAVVPSVYSLVMMSTAFVVMFIGSRWDNERDPSPALEEN
jgi:bile acid:Na+ symporter, BASS family